MARQNQLARMGTRRRDGGYKSRSRVSVRKGPLQRSRKTLNAMARLHKGAGITRIPYGVSENIETTLTYCDTYTLTTATTGTPVSKYYSMNGLYDPDPALGGNQPYWFDQYTAMYERYSVIGAKAIVKFTVAAGAATANVGPWVVGVITDRNTTTVPTTTPQLIGSQNSNWKTIDGDYKGVTCIATYSPEKSLGKSSWDDSVAGTSSSNPTNGWWVGLFASTQGTVGATDVRAVIEIQYRVRFSSVIDNAGS